MEKKILVAVDDSLPSRRAVEYAGRMSAVIPGLRLTLLHVQPAISRFLLEEAESNPATRAQLKQLLARNAEAGAAVLDRNREFLARMGIAAAAAEALTQPRHLGLAKDILDTAQKGLFDAVVIGRRGVSALQAVFAGSVSASLVDNSRLIPIWLVDGEVSSTRILAAVDGSEASFKAVDHLAFMLSGNPLARLTFFHVTPKLGDFCEVDFSQEPGGPELAEVILRGDKRCMDDFFATALKKFAETGLGEDRIEIKTHTAMIGVGKSILSAARAGGFGTLVLGRRGMNKAFFSGSVSQHVVENLADAAAWIIP
jgi:nucleotide-binding universal stress UspA family protein